LTDVATHLQAARALLGLAQACAERRDVLRSRAALKARCVAALVGSSALQTLLASSLAPAAAAAASATGALVPLAQLGFVASDGCPAALAALLRSSDSGVAAAAVAAFTLLLTAKKQYIAPAVASVAAHALCARLAVGGARSAWLACASALAQHAAGLEALRRDAAAPAAFTLLLCDDSLVSGALALCATCADGEHCESAAAFAARLVAADGDSLRGALRAALRGASLTDAASALRLLAALAPVLPRSALGAWTALAPDVVTALCAADTSMHEGELMAGAIATLLRRTQPPGVYGAPAAASPWHAPLLEAGVTSALLAAALTNRPYGTEHWRALACIACCGLGSPEHINEVAAAACAALLDYAPPDAHGLRGSHGSQTTRNGSGDALRISSSVSAGEALLAILTASLDVDVAQTLKNVRQTLHEDVGSSSFSLVACTAASLASRHAGRAMTRPNAEWLAAVQALARAALGAGLRGSPESMSELAKHHRVVDEPAVEPPPWGAWTPCGDACWSAAGADKAGALLRWIAVTLASDEHANTKTPPWRAPLMELLEGLAAPAGGLCTQSRCWAALALRRGCGRCGARTQLGEDFGAALQPDLARFADVALSCGDGGAPQPAHSVILAARCPRLLPSKAADGSAVTLRGGVPPAALSAVLSWAYTGSCDATTLLDQDAVAATVQLAKRANLWTLAALLSDALPRPGDDMPCLARDMRRSLGAGNTAGGDAQLLPGFDAAPVRVHRVICAARCDYFRAALSPAFAASGDAAATLRCSELCGAGAQALQEWLYCGAVHAFQADAPARRDAVAVAARVAAAADTRLLPALAAAARAWALAAVPALQPVDAAHAASDAAAAGEWGIASAAVYSAAGAFPALRDGGELDSLPPSLAEAIRQAHVQRASDAA
jgi:hypothetical protein